MEVKTDCSGRKYISHTDSMRQGNQGAGEIKQLRTKNTELEAENEDIKLANQDISKQCVKLLNKVAELEKSRECIAELWDIQRLENSKLQVQLNAIYALPVVDIVRVTNMEYRMLITGEQLLCCTDDCIEKLIELPPIGEI